ncbi:hypothetical protein RKD18_001102 [Streptomyces phaeoluteigriseus]
MPESHQSPDIEQSRRYGRPGGVRADLQKRDGASEQRRVTDRLSRGGQQQLLRRGRQRADAREVAPLDAAGHPSGTGRSGFLARFRLDAAVGEFEQCEGVAACFGENAVADPLVHRTAGRGVQQRPGVGVVQALEGQLRQAGQVVTSPLFTGGEDQSQRFGEHSSRHEGQCLRGDPVEPLCVVHDTEQRLPGGYVGQQPEYGETDQEPVRRRSRADPECRGQGVTLWRRKGIGVSEKRSAQLM